MHCLTQLAAIISLVQVLKNTLNASASSVSSVICRRATIGLGFPLSSSYFEGISGAFCGALFAPRLPGACWDCCFYSGVILLPQYMVCAHVSLLLFAVRFCFIIHYIMTLIIFPFPLHQYSLLLKGNHIALGARERQQPCRGALQDLWVLGGLGSARRVQFWEGAGKTWAAEGVPVFSSRPFVLITLPLVSGHLGTDFMPGSLTLKALFSFSSLFLPYFSLVLVLVGSTFQVRHTVLIEHNVCDNSGWHWWSDGLVSMSVSSKIRHLQSERRCR